MKRRKQKKKKQRILNMGVAWYKPEQWSRLREISSDRDELEESYEEWRAQAESAIHDMSIHGLVTEKVVVDTEALLWWCNEREREVDATSRTHYVAWVLMERDKAKDRAT